MSFAAFIFVPSVSAGFSANQRNDTLALQKVMSSQYHFSAPYLPFSSSLPLSAPLLFSVICSLACSFSLINSLIKTTTSKSQLQGLCLHVFIQDGNSRNKQDRHYLPLLLLFLHSLPPPHPKLSLTVVHLCHWRQLSQCPGLSGANNCLMSKVNSGVPLPES